MIRRPGAGRGPGLLIFVVWFLGCLQSAVIGRVSPRRATIFLVATRKMDKEAPPAAAPASPVPSLHPRPAGRVVTRPAGSDIDATIPAGRGLRSALQKGKALPARLRHCRRAVVPSFRARHPGTIRRPGEGRGPGPTLQDQHGAGAFGAILAIRSRVPSYSSTSTFIPTSSRPGPSCSRFWPKNTWLSRRR